MSLYQAPLKDMQLLVQQAIAKAGLRDLPELAEFDDELVAAVLEEAGKFAQGELAPLNQSGDVEGCHFDNGKVTTPKGWKEAYQQFCDAGWMGLALPADFGGQSLPKFIAQPVNEMWLSANLAFVMFHALTQGGSEILLHMGSEEQKARYLGPIVSGQWTVAMSLTEPNAGSDLGSLSTKAIPQDDGHYLIKGQKIFITYGEHDLAENIIHLVLARTPDAPAGSRGISLFAVPKVRINADGSLGDANDVVCTGIEHKTGLHGSPTCSISYGDQDGCFGELIGEENRGLAAMFILMNEARLSSGLQGVAFGEVGFQRALEYSLERTQGSDYQTGKQRVKIAQHPDVARMLLSIRSEVMGLRSLAYLIAALIDKSELTLNAAERKSLQARVALLTPIFKAFATEHGNLMTGTTIQIFGGMGFIEETGVAQLMRDARINTIYEGTTGIQARDLVFRKIQSDGGEAISALLAEIVRQADALQRDDALSTQGQALRSACSAVTESLPCILNRDSANLLQLNAGAVPLLEALGTLCCAWQLAELAQLAQSRLREGQDPDYYSNLLALTRFYFAFSVPNIHARLATFRQADAGVEQYRFEV
ncbi:acyl-CoA dehydrogenase [Marinobacterium zhoushanense]|uniref:Acyl-CoA dehydrogenase n=1 Tax=Marinobacterium zhoushanense TaxID=1679163 RepID=A0ABQ1KH05_9GAMM|nr:acyl-CoA dehydrogenase [Marinobacterium zhoushanense]GGB97263.1 acyl-CoA dehydrogenase [Marinobacterium zhoushanense]